MAGKRVAAKKPVRRGRSSGSGAEFVVPPAAKLESIEVVVGSDGRIAEHVVHLRRYNGGGWHWERKARNGTTVAQSHRNWDRRRDAESNLGLVNAQPFRLEVHE